jgi:predicted PhzF superfamily epimerase YddE/YHI9
MPIRLCGHGLLSCGTVWSHTDTPVQTLIMHDTEAQFERRDGTGWVGLAPLASSDCAVPQWTTTLFGSPPARAATAGQSDDYLILVWADDFPLRELALPANLAQHTQRAVIATCLNARQPGFDICFRYFAPQHGIAEDVATGSAMRVLATFWQQQLGDSLRAMQCSPQGGELLSRVEPGITWVGGNVLSHDSGSCA